MRHDAHVAVGGKRDPDQLACCSTGKSCICVGVEAKYSLSIHLSSKPQTSVFDWFFAVYKRSVQKAFFFRQKLEKESYGKASRRSWSTDVAGFKKKQTKLSCHLASSEAEHVT